jgi:N-dimethylarginine dimethylaminohydrolase
MKLEKGIKRREFMAAAAMAAGAAGATMMSWPAKSQASQKKTTKGREWPISVHHEWGVLKEAVCGVPFARIPKSLPKNIYNYAPDQGIKFFEANPGKTLEEADPGLYGRVKKQMDAVVDILKERGVRVHRPPAMNRVEEQYLSELFPTSSLQYYPRDPMLVIGNRFMETGMFFPVRRRERFPIRRLLAERLAQSDAQMVSMPPAFPQPETEQGGWGPGPFIEGGDVLLLGRDIYVGVSGNASNMAGVRWLAQYLGGAYRVHAIALTKKFLHLDCCLSTPRPGLAIICKEAFVDGLPAFLKGWHLIELPYEEAKQMLGCNGLILDDKTIIIHTDLPHLGKALRAAGQEVIETPFDAVYNFGGAFRCWHHPLVRESGLV